MMHTAGIFPWLRRSCTDADIVSLYELGKKKSFLENPEQDRQHHGNDNACGQWKVKLKIPRLENKITWQPAQIQFL